MATTYMKGEGLLFPETSQIYCRWTTSLISVISIITIGYTVLSGPWNPLANVVSDLYLGHPRTQISTTQFPCLFLYPVNPS